MIRRHRDSIVRGCVILKPSVFLYVSHLAWMIFVFVAYNWFQKTGDFCWFRLYNFIYFCTHVAIMTLGCFVWRLFWFTAFCFHLVNWGLFDCNCIMTKFLLVQILHHAKNFSSLRTIYAAFSCHRSSMTTYFFYRWLCRLRDYWLVCLCHYYSAGRGSWVRLCITNYLLIVLQIVRKVSFSLNLYCG